MFTFFCEFFKTWIKRLSHEASGDSFFIKQLSLYQRLKNMTKTSMKRQLSRVEHQFATTLKTSRSAFPRSGWACSPPTSYPWILRWADIWIHLNNDFSLEKNEGVSSLLFLSSIICSKHFYRFLSIEGLLTCLLSCFSSLLCVCLILNRWH